MSLTGFSGVPLAVRIKVTKRARLRLWIATRITAVAAWVIRCGRAIALDLDTASPDLTDEGLPRALSVSERYKGYHRHAAVVGQNLIVRLDGVEQQDVIAYDIDAGIVTRYARNAGCNLRQVRLGEKAMDDFVIERHRGVVTVERQSSTPAE
jgi:hypothetical protein